MANVVEQAESTNEKLDALANQFAGLSTWMQTVETAVTSLTTTAATLKLHAEDTAARLGAIESRSPQQPTSPAVLSTTPLQGAATRRPEGLGIDTTARGQLNEIYGSPRFPPNNGTIIPHASTRGYSDEAHHDRSVSHSRYHSTPKMDFPKFDGTDPTIWKDNCEMYFEIYGISEHMKVKFAMLNFVGNAALWLKTLQTKQAIILWQELYTAVEAYWGKNKFNLFMRQILVLRQTDTVEVYTEKFKHLQHQILLHAPSTSEVFFVERYIAGLADELRSSVLLHLPQDVDTASLLAQLQETELENQKHQQSRSNSRSTYRTHSLPDKTKPSSRTDDAKKQDTPRWDDKLEALRAYRKAKGLCFTCGEKWSKAHKCPAQIPLHVLEELLDVLPMEHGASGDNSGDESSEDELMCVDLATTTDTAPPRRRTIRLHGRVGSHEVLILVDSGSGASFIDTALVAKLGAQTQPCEPSRFVVANGATMISDSKVPQITWSTQGHEFVQDLRVLPLSCYDIILGGDWLEEHSPMWVHWRQRRMRFTYKGKRITLQGIHDSGAVGSVISARQLKGLLRRGAISQCIQVQPVHQEASLHTVTEVPATDVPPQLIEVLQEFKDLFQDTDKLPPRRQQDHKIPLIPGAQPVNTRPYRYAPHQKDEIERQIHQMLRQGIIRHSTSPFASPVLLVRKKDGTWRFCIDYRQLNAITVKHKHPMPVVEELLDELAGACWFTKLDLSSGYHQLRVAEGDEYKTAFRTHQGLYEFLVMPFGLTNAPATFQSVMNSIFENLLRKGVLVFMDDILIYSPSLEQHIHQVREVFLLLRAHGLHLKQAKCNFAQQNLEYLGHVIGTAGVATDSSKIAAVQSWPRPSNLKELRGFLGLTGYYRKFIKNYGIISRPLTHLLRKGTLFQWTPVTEEAFSTLKEALVKAPVLALPDFAQPFVIETDACQYGVGAVLMQHGHPIAYLSKALSPRNQALSTYEKECIAILMAVDKWRSYLQQQEFVIRTDQKSLLHLTDQRLGTGIQHKAFVKLMGLRYTIQYKKGITNAAADALSRRPTSSEFMAISSVVPSWMDKLISGYSDDPTTKQLWAELSISGANADGFSLDKGIIRRNGKIWVGGNSLAQQHIMQALHDSGIGGHSGTLATYHRIHKLFAWPNLKQSVTEYVQSCDVCQRVKTEHTKLPGLLQPLPVPKQAWHTISLDFVEGLPKSNGYDVILVVIDKLTKYAHFLPLKHPFTASQVATVFTENVYKLHGLPHCIISDRDKIFTSLLWQELFKLTDTQLLMSSSYHPQTDGQSERLIQCLETFLRGAVHSCPTKWFRWLHLAEFWYNTSFHSALGRSPFEALYGHPPRQFGISAASACAVPELEFWLQEREVMTSLLRQHLLRAQQRMKQQADKHRMERSFEVGEMVFLKLQPYVQTSLAPRSSQKLAFRFFGPYMILSRVGEVAYKLDLPPTSRIHNVVHVSQLKKQLPATQKVSDDLALLCLDDFALLQPASIIARRAIRRGSTTVPRVLVRWHGLPSSSVTWEDETALKLKFPNSLAWGQASSQGGENVTTQCTSTSATTQQEVHGKTQSSSANRD